MFEVILAEVYKYLVSLWLRILTDAVKDEIIHCSVKFYIRNKVERFAKDNVFKLKLLKKK